MQKKIKFKIMQNYTEKEVAYGALGPLQITSIILYI